MQRAKAAAPLVLALVGCGKGDGGPIAFGGFEAVRGYSKRMEDLGLLAQLGVDSYGPR